VGDRRRGAVVAGCRLAGAGRIGRLPGAEVVWEPTISQGLVRFEDDRHTDEVIEAILRSGEAFSGEPIGRGTGACE